MQINTLSRFIVLAIAIMGVHGCSVSGPVHFYEGAPQPTDEIAHVIVPAPITVLEIDGKDADVPSKEDGVYHIYLLPGVHRMDFKYELFWGSNESGFLVKSDVMGIETRFAAGKTYELKYREPADQEEAEELAFNFSAKLVEQETGRVVVARTPKELERRGVQTSLVNQPVSSQQTATLPTPPSDIDANAAVQEDAVKRLKFWWLMADESERQRFMQWMKSIEPKDKPGTPAEDTSQ